MFPRTRNSAPNCISSPKTCMMVTSDILLVVTLLWTHIPTRGLRDALEHPRCMQIMGLILIRGIRFLFHNAHGQESGQVLLTHYHESNCSCFFLLHQMWSERLEKITSVSEQLCSHVALNIMMNLEDAHSTYAQSFHLVKREIAKVRSLKHCQSCVSCTEILLDTPFYTMSNK